MDFYPARLGRRAENWITHPVAVPSRTEEHHEEVHLISLPKRFPYLPPSSRALANLSDVYRPPGTIFLSEALNMFGRRRFGAEWTGEELTAREVVDTVFDPPQVPEDGVLQRLAAFDGVQRSPGLSGPWEVTTLSGSVFCRSEAEALELWKRERPKLVSLWKNERHVRTRFDAVVREVRDSLVLKRLKSWALRPSVGDLVIIPAHVWMRDAIVRVFELGDEEIRWRNPNPITFYVRSEAGGSIKIEGRVLLSEPQVEFLLNPLPTPPQHDDTSGSVIDAAMDFDDTDKAIPQETQDKKSRGRPPEFDWSSFDNELDRLAGLPNGFPKKQASLEQQMTAWCTDNWDRAPKERTTRNHVSQYLKSRQKRQ